MIALGVRKNANKTESLVVIIIHLLAAEQDNIIICSLSVLPYNNVIICPRSQQINSSLPHCINHIIIIRGRTCPIANQRANKLIDSTCADIFTTQFFTTSTV